MGPPRSISPSVCLLLVGLAACETPPEADAADRASHYSETCVALMEQEPGHAILARHMPLGGQPATVAQRVDRARPLPAERIALRKWKADLVGCRQPSLQAAGVFVPELGVRLRRNYLLSDEVIDALIAGRTTWGDANQRRDAIAYASSRAVAGQRAAGSALALPCAHSVGGGRAFQLLSAHTATPPYTRMANGYVKPLTTRLPLAQAMR